RLGERDLLGPKRPCFAQLAEREMGEGCVRAPGNRGTRAMQASEEVAGRQEIIQSQGGPSGPSGDRTPMSESAWEGVAGSALAVAYVRLSVPRVDAARGHGHHTRRERGQTPAAMVR